MTTDDDLVLAKHPAESGHWYTRIGEQVTEVPRADGNGTRPCKLTDARKLDLARGVTSIIAKMARPGLVRWQQQETIRCALTLPRRADEPEAAWLDRILDDSRETARKAADAGTKIHAALEAFFGGRTFEQRFRPHVLGVCDLFSRVLPQQKWAAEVSCVSTLGYGTKADLVSDSWLVDFKGTEGAVENLKLYPEHWMQLGATEQALSRQQRRRCAIVYVHRVNGEASIIEVERPQLDRGFAMFCCCLRLSQIQDDFKPTWAVDDVPFFPVNNRNETKRP